MVNENEVITIKLDDIIPNRFQPREVFDEQALNELAESIKLHGVIQPIIVRPVDNKYEIIAGERRYKASLLAGKTDIPALVKNKDDKESSIIAFIENSQRKNVSPIEEAKTCERLLASNDMTQEQLAKQLGMSQSTLANKLRLLTLPIEVQDSLLNGEISERHARNLLTVKDTKQQLDLLNKIKNEKMTVRELEGEIKNMLGNDGMNEQGLYDLPMIGEDTNKEVAPVVPTGINPIGEIKEEVASPVTPVTEETVVTPPKEERNSSFLSFLNEFDDTKVAESITTEEPKEEVKEETQTPEVPSNLDNFLNDFEVKEETKEDVPITAPTLETPIAPPVAPASNDGFDDFLKQYENNPTNPVTQDVPSVPETPVVNPVTDDGFNDFLSQYEKKPEEESKQAIEPVLPEVPVTPEEENPKEEISQAENNDNDFMNFLNNTDIDTSKYLNPVDEETPVTDALVEEKPNYVEDDPNYVDTSKPKSYDNIDEIITEIKGVTDKVKQSKYKITTDEVNFDDIYQIKITIDKREQVE